MSGSEGISAVIESPNAALAEADNERRGFEGCVALIGFPAGWVIARAVAGMGKIGNGSDGSGSNDSTNSAVAKISGGNAVGF